MTDDAAFNVFWNSKSRHGLGDIERQICYAGFLSGRASQRSEAHAIHAPTMQQARQEDRLPGGSEQLARVESLLDQLIDQDPSLAQRWIESTLAKSALRKQLAEKKAHQTSQHPV